MLPVISKIIEKLIHDQLITFLDGAIFVDLSKALDTTQCCFNGCQKSWNERHNFIIFLSLASPSPPTMMIYLEIWIQSLGTGVRFVLPNVLFSKSNMVPGGGGGYRFH